MASGACFSRAHPPYSARPRRCCRGLRPAAANLVLRRKQAAAKPIVSVLRIRLAAGRWCCASQRHRRALRPTASYRFPRHSMPITASSKCWATASSRSRIFCRRSGRRGLLAREKAGDRFRFIMRPDRGDVVRGIAEIVVAAAGAPRRGLMYGKGHAAGRGTSRGSLSFFAAAGAGLEPRRIRPDAVRHAVGASSPMAFDLH